MSQVVVISAIIAQVVVISAIIAQVVVITIRIPQVVKHYKITTTNQIMMNT